MEKFYFIVFWVGVIYTVVTFLMGGLFEIGHIGAHFDTHFDTHIDSNASATSYSVFPIKPITIVSFLTVFGGMGIIGTQKNFNQIAILIVSMLSGLVVSFILYRFIVVPLYKAQNTSAVSQDKLIGMKATVIYPILEDGFGTISYIVNGSKYNAPAQHLSKKAVPQGDEVIIYEIKNNLFYVQPLNERD